MLVTSFISRPFLCGRCTISPVDMSGRRKPAPPAGGAWPGGCSFTPRRLRVLAKRLHRLEAPLVIREDRVGHFSRRLGAAQPLRVELQGCPSLSETLQDERRPRRQVFF